MEKDKRERLTEIAREIQELYPHLDGVIIDDMENPERIVFMSQIAMMTMSEELGFDVEDITSEPEMLEYDGYWDDDDDDEDGNGGMLQ